MYNQFDTKKKIIYLQVLQATIQELLDKVTNHRNSAITPQQTAALQEVLTKRIPGLVAETERSEQVWLEGMMKNNQDWQDIVLPDLLATEAQMVDFIGVLSRDIEHQLFLVGGSDRLLTLLTALSDIRLTHYQRVVDEKTLEHLSTLVVTRLNQEVNFKELDTHHRDYLVAKIANAGSLTGLRAILNNALYHFNLELLTLRKEQQIKAGAMKTGGSLKAE